MIRRMPLYPLLFAAYPVVALLAANLQYIPLTALWRPLLIVLLATMALMLVMGTLLKDWEKTALTVTLALFLIFSFGHVFRAVRGDAPRAETATAYLILFSIWSSIFIVGPWWIWRVMSRVNENLRRFLNVSTSVVILLPLGQIALHIAQPGAVSGANTNTPVSSAPTAITLKPPENLPDIYYIILDGYGRADVLEEVYDYDNSQFLDFLRARDFYVAEDSRANYMQTALSLAASLNVTYVDALFSGRRPPQSLHRMAGEIRNSRVISILKDIGYKTVAISSGFPPSEIVQADVYWTPFEHSVNDLEILLIENSYFGLILERNLAILHRSYDAHRTRILHSLESLEDTSVRGPKFVFAHILAPHPPFIFGPKGEWVRPDHEYALFDGDTFLGTRDEYVAGYRDQLHYITQRMQEIIDYILAQSASPPIIIIQGDHGPGALLHWLSAEESCLKERMGIFNAYYLPGITSSELYETITPVNSFRVIFNAYFQTNLPLLSDESYFSTLLEPFDFTNVTTQIESQCLLDE